VTRNTRGVDCHFPHTAEARPMPNPRGSGTCLMHHKKTGNPRRLVLKFDAPLASAPSSAKANDGDQEYTAAAADIDLRPDKTYLVIKFKCTKEKSLKPNTVGPGDTGTLTVTLTGGTPADVNDVPVVYVADNNG